MAIAFVQTTTGSANSTSIPTSAFSTATTTSKFIVVVISAGATANVVKSITDTAGNTYTKLFSVTTGSVVGLDMWYAANIVGVSSNIVTATRSPSGLTLIAACEYSGIATAPADVSVTGTGASSTAAASGSTATTAVATELVVGGVGAGALGTSTATAGSGYSNLAQLAGSGIYVAHESKIVSSTGTQSAAFTLNASDYWVCGCATFKGVPEPIGKRITVSTAVQRSYFY